MGFVGLCGQKGIVYGCVGCRGLWECMGFYGAV